MNDPQPIDLRRRIRELLSIPDRDRTDAEWDELNELEIRTAPGNRDNGYPSDRPDGKRQGGFGQGRRQGPHVKKGGGQRVEPRQQGQDNRQEGARPDGNRPDGQGRPPKRQHRRPKRPQVEGQPQQPQQPQPPAQTPSSSSGNTDGNS